MILQVAKIVQSCMENAVELQVPLKVKLSYGETWGTLVPLVIEQQQKFSSLPPEDSAL